MIEKVMKDSLGELKDFFRKRKHFQNTPQQYKQTAMDSIFSDNLAHINDWLKSSSLLSLPQGTPQNNTSENL